MNTIDRQKVTICVIHLAWLGNSGLSQSQKEDLSI